MVISRGVGGGGSSTSSYTPSKSKTVITTPRNVASADYYSPGGGAYTSSEQKQLDAAGYNPVWNSGNTARDYLRGINSSGSPGTTGDGGGGGGGGGGGWGGGGGGGGGGGSQLTQAMVDMLAGIYADAAPDKLKANKFTYDPYKAGAFYKFDPSQYNRAATGLTNSVADARRRAGNAYGDAQTELDQYQNSFSQAPMAMDPGVSAAMQRMMQAQGVDPSAANAQQGEAVQADRAMQSVLGMLAANANEAQGARQRALSGDMRRTDENLSAQQTELKLAIDMAKARALSEYEKEKWQYGEQVARQRYEDKMAIAQQNWNRQNQVNDQNVANQNQFSQGMLDPITELMMANPKLKFDELKNIIG